MFKRGLISFILLMAFSMLQAHNMRPHQHDAPKSHSHGHGAGHHHHHHGDKAPSSPSNNDHSVEFGKAVVKPGNNKYELFPLKYVPLVYQTKLSGLYQIIPQAVPQRACLFIPPGPCLGVVGLRGPPSIV